MSEGNAPNDYGVPPPRDALWDILPAVANEPPPGDVRPDVARQTSDPITTAKVDWESAVDGLTQLVVVLDEHGRVVRTSRALERWKVGKVTEANGRTLHELLHPACQSARCYLGDVWTSARHDLAHYGAWTHETDDAALGRRLAIEMRSLAASATGVPPRVVALIEDVTSRRETEARLRRGHAELEQQVSARARDLLYANSKLRAEIETRRTTEQNLRKSEACYRSLVDTMLEGMLVYDPTGIIVYANESLCRMFGMERAELVGEPLDRIFAGMQRRSLQGECDPDVPGSCRRYEAEWRSKDGSVVTALVSAQRLDGPDGEHLGDFGVVMDITDRKRSERGMRLLSAQLLGAQEVERKRIANELHDSLGQTLGALKFEIERAAMKAGEGDTAAVSGLLGRLVPKFQSAIEEVRRISMDLRPAMLDDLGVLPTLAWFCREYQNVYPSVELDLRLELREENIPSCLKTAIYRIVQEALSNIARHARARRIQLVLEARASSIELQIIDDGVGFDSATLATNATDRRGLGLRTMRERAESTGGSFRIESGGSEGTCLAVSWPRMGT